MRLRLALAAAWLAACAGAPVRDLTEPIGGTAASDVGALERVQMSPFYFEGGAAGLDIYTDSDLFRRAGDAYDAGEWKAAFNLYRKIIDKFPDSDYRILATFNAGLCLEQLAENERAVDYFLAAQALTPPGAALGRDIGLHLGAVYERLGRWREAAVVFERAYARDDLSEADRWQFESRALTAKAYADEDDASLDALEAFASRYAKVLESRPDLENEWLARARFSLGDVYFRRFRAVRLELPAEKLRDDLERKAEMLLRAQSQFMRTLQIKNVEWATAAVYRIGLGYEEFYHALNTAPVPPELSAEEREVYAAELREATDPVRRKAIIAYDRIISFANRLAVRTDWVEKAKQRVVELRTAGRFSEPEGTALR